MKHKYFFYTWVLSPHYLILHIFRCIRGYLAYSNKPNTSDLILLWFLYNILKKDLLPENSYKWKKPYSLCFKWIISLNLCLPSPPFLKEFRAKSREWDKQEILYQTHLVSLDAQQKILSEKYNQFQVNYLILSSNSEELEAIYWYPCHSTYNPFTNRNLNEGTLTRLDPMTNLVYMSEMIVRLKILLFKWCMFLYAYRKEGSWESL